MTMSVLTVRPLIVHSYLRSSFFSFHDTAPTEIYTLSLHYALPILGIAAIIFVNLGRYLNLRLFAVPGVGKEPQIQDRKSTRLNSSHVAISYAVFCLKKKRDDLTKLCRLYNMDP